jgi:hypothetical protein
VSSRNAGQPTEKTSVITEMNRWGFTESGLGMVKFVSPCRTFEKRVSCGQSEMATIATGIGCLLLDRLMTVFLFNYGQIYSTGIDCMQSRHLSPEGTMARKKIVLEEIPELNGFVIIRTVEELDAFFKKLRQDYYAPDLPEMVKVREDFSVWVALKKRGTQVFYAVFDEPDDLAKNDGWGRHVLFSCSVLRNVTGEAVVVKNKIKDFFH